MALACLSLAELEQLVGGDGTVTPHEHVSDCVRCARTISEIQENNAFLATIAPALESASAGLVREPLPEQLGRYPVQRLLGRGGMGEVFLAEDRTLRRPVAVKILPRAGSGSVRQRERFEREARALAALNHPHIATIYSLEEDDLGAYLLTMEYVSGDSLSDRLKQAERMAVDEALRLAWQVASALEAAHDRGVIHRDLKPQNIQLTADGDAKVLDFGLARLDAELHRDVAHENERLPMPGAIMGTPGYMSPEQLKGDNVSHLADVWAWGCLLFECLTGEPVFGLGTQDERCDRTLAEEPRFERLPSDVPDELRPLLRRALEKDPAERLPSMTDAKRVLTAYVDHDAKDLSDAPARPSLPVPRSTFVGREQELESIEQRVLENRLVTLTGSGGGGKSRLALEAARRQRARFDDGVWLVELASVVDEVGVWQAVAKLFDVRKVAGESLDESIAHRLRFREVLLVLDNCEHLLEPCRDLVGAILSRSPRSRIIATSRERLVIDGESVLRVPPLAVPESDHASPDELARIESVRLFCDRAQSATGQSVANDEITLVASICRKLDGIPLAVELAAARVHVLSIPEIADRLSDRLRLFARPSTGRPAESGTRRRQSTLQALFDWSYDLLDDEEQRFFRAVSVFAGRWTLDAAEALFPEAGDSDGLEWVGRLVEKSLIERIPIDRLARVGGAGGAGSRYRMLETVRSYARERLEASPEVAAVRESHREYFLRLAKTQAERLRGDDQLEALWVLECEHDDLILAIDSSAKEAPDRGLALVGALFRYWMIRGHWGEGRALSAKVLEQASGESSSTEVSSTTDLAATYECAGLLAQMQCDYDSARSNQERALEHWRTLGHASGIASSLQNLAASALHQGDYAQAKEWAGEALTIVRDIGHELATGHTLVTLGNVHLKEGDLETARKYCEDGRMIAEQKRDRYLLAAAVHNLGEVESAGGNPEEARRLFNQALATNREIQNRAWEARNLISLSLVALDSSQGAEDRRENVVSARALLEEAFRRLGDDADPIGLQAALESAALVLEAEHRYERSAKLLGAAERYRAQLGAPLSAARELRVATSQQRLSERLSEEAFQAALRAGETLAVDDARERFF